MPRRPPRDYYEDESYDSDDRDRLPRRRPRREREPIIDDDPERYRRGPSPLAEMEHLRIRERSVPEYPRDYDEFDSREPRRRSPRRTRDVERDEWEFDDRERDRGGHRDRGRRKYVERSDEEDDMPRGGGWKPSAGYISDEESIQPDRRRRYEFNKWDYERPTSPPRASAQGRGRRRHKELDSDEDASTAKGGWKPSSAGYPSDDDEFIGRSRRMRKEVRSPAAWDYERHESPRGRDRGRREDLDSEDASTVRGEWKPSSAGFPADDDEFIGRSRRIRKEFRGPPESDYEPRGSFPRRSDRDELDMEYGAERDEFRDRAGSRSRAKPRFHEDEDEVRIRKDVRARYGRGPWKDDRDDEFRPRKKRVSPSISPRSRGWSPDRAPDRLDDDDYEIPAHPPRVPSPFGPRRVSVDELDIRSRGRRRSPENAALREWGDAPRSPPPVRRMSPERDEWEKREDVSISRRPRSVERKADALASEWDAHRRSKTAFDLEEDTYRRGSDRISSHDSATDDWAIVDAPPRPRRATRDELDGPSRELRRHHHGRERPIPAGEGILSGDEVEPGRGEVGRRYVGAQNPKDRLWTEITKDLVVKEAIERSGYEFEETEFFYYIFDYLQYEDVSALVDLSDEIRHARRRRIHEIHRERTSMPPPGPPPISAERRSAPLLMDRERVPSPRLRLRDEREIPRLRDRDLVIEDSRRRRPPPMPRFDW